MLEEIVEAEIYEVVDAFGCLDKIHEVVPDIVFLDILMPRLCGDEICYNLKNTPNTKHIPVIFVSSMSKDDYESFYGASMADGYLNKPLEVEAVRTIINGLMAVNAKGSATLPNYSTTCP